MELTTYANVWTPDMLYIDGVKRRPGHLLRDVLKENDGSYTVTASLPEVLIAAIRQEVASTGDADLVAVAKTGTISISLEHLRGFDPTTTRIVYGVSWAGQHQVEPAQSTKG